MYFLLVVVVDDVGVDGDDDDIFLFCFVVFPFT